MKEKQNLSDVIPAMFFSAAIAMIFTNFVDCVSVLIDGIITSKLLGHDAYSAIALFNPLNGLLIVINNVISVGSHVIIPRYVGTGDKDKANSVFSVTLLLVAAAASTIIMLWLLFPDILLRTAGVSIKNHPQLYSDMTSYINGFIYGLPLLMIIQMIGPVIVIDGGKKLFTFSAVSMCVFNIAGNLVNGLIIHGGTFGMGLSTSLAYLFQLGILMTHFMKSSSYFGFSLSAFSLDQLSEIVKAGSPTFVRRLTTTIRELLVNRFNLSIALTTAAVAARGIQTDINTVLFCLGLGIGKTLITMTGIYYGSDDRPGITRLFSYAIKMSVILSGAAGIVMFIAAPFIAGAFSDVPEVMELGTFSIRCMALGIMPDVLVSALMGYLQGINNRRFLNAVNILDRLIAPLISAVVLGTLFGPKGVMASLAVSKLILVIFVLVLIWIRTKRFAIRLEDFMFLPESFGGAESDNIYASISTIDDALKESKRAEEFCLNHGTDEKKAKMMSLFIEEMAVNIVKHGLAHKRRKIGADYRLSISGGTLCLTLRDLCEHFDPVAFYNAHNNGSSENMLDGVVKVHTE